MPPRKRLGQLLTELGVVDDLQLQSALGHQKQWGGKLGTILVQKGFCREEDVVRVLAQHLALPVVRLAELKIDPKAVKLVSRQVAEKLHVFAFEVSGAGRSEVVTVAMSDPTDLSSVDQLAFHTGKRIKPVLCGDSEIVVAIEQNYPGEATPTGQPQPGQPAQQTARTAPGGRPLPPLGPPPVMQPIRPTAGQPATPPAPGQRPIPVVPLKPAVQAAVPNASAPVPAALKPVPQVPAPRPFVPAGVGAPPQPVPPQPAPPRSPPGTPARPGIEGMESIAASAAAQSAVEGTEAFNDQGQTADAVVGIEPISDSTIGEGRSIAETDIAVEGDFGEAPGDGQMEGLEPIAAHSQDAMESGAAPEAAAAAPVETDWDAPAEAPAGGQNDPGGWDAPVSPVAPAGWADAAPASAEEPPADELPADELPADAILGTAEDVLGPGPDQEPASAVPTGLPAWEETPAPERSPWDDGPAPEAAAPQPTQSPWGDESAQEAAAPVAAPSPWEAQPAQEAVSPEAAPSSWGDESAQQTGVPETAPSPWGDEPAPAAAPAEPAAEAAPAPEAEPGPGASADWGAEAPAQFAAATPDAPATPDAAPAPDAAAGPAPDEPESHAKTGKLFGFLAASFDMAPPDEAVAPSPEAGAAAAAAGETQAGAEGESHGEAEAPDGWSEVADPLAAEAQGYAAEAGTEAAAPSVEAGTETVAGELAPAAASGEPEEGASIPVEWAEDVPLDQESSPADDQSSPAAEPTAEELERAAAQPADAFAPPPGNDGGHGDAVQAAEESQAQPGVEGWPESAPSFDEAPPTDRIPFGEPAADAASEDAFADQGGQESEASASDEISLDDSAAGATTAREETFGEELAAEGQAELATREFAAPEPPAGELAADRFGAEEPGAREPGAEETASEGPGAVGSANPDSSPWEPAAPSSAEESGGEEPAPPPLGLERYAVPGWVPPPPEPQPEGSGWLGQALASTPEPLSEAEEEMLRAAGVEPSDGMGAMRLLAGLLRALQRRGVLEVSEVAADISAARSAGLDAPAPEESGAEADADHPA